MAKLTPTAYAKALYDVTKDLPRNQVEGVISRFVTMLKQRGLLHWGMPIARAYERYAQERDQETRAVVTVAHELSARERNELEQLVKQSLHASDVAVHVDVGLLGGGIIRKGTTIIDMSVRGMLSPLIDA